MPKCYAPGIYMLRTNHIPAHPRGALLIGRRMRHEREGPRKTTLNTYTMEDVPYDTVANFDEPAAEQASFNRNKDKARDNPVA